MTAIGRHEKRILHDPERRRAWIIYQLNLQGRSLADVARVEGRGVSRQTLYTVFNRPYVRMEKAIADALGLSPQDVFPERYDRDGMPVRKRRKAA